MNAFHARLVPLVPAGLACLLCGAPVAAQDVGATPAPSSPVAPGATEPMPWYIGASQGFTHDTNVYRTTNGPGDTYSSTSLFGGFDQLISRQRVHGSANVSLNRYFDEKTLDNTSYDFNLGLDWETAYSLSGSLDGGLRQHLAYPAARSGVPSQELNLGRTRYVDARGKWGGTSIFSVEGSLRYSSIDYSDESYQSSESTGKSANLAVYYGRGGPLRVGIGGRYDRTETPKAGFDPIAAEFLSNTTTQRHADLFADYEVLGQITTNARLSYTKQTNTLVEAADFSGWTGRIGMVWQATGKLAVNAYASRDSGFDSAFGTVTFVPPGSPPGTLPVTRLYENNRLTYAYDLGALYSATAKIDVNAGILYTRAHLVSAATDLTVIESTDHRKVFYLGANYNFLRNGWATCKLARELRDVTGGTVYSYSSTSIGCNARFIYR